MAGEMLCGKEGSIGRMSCNHLELGLEYFCQRLTISSHLMVLDLSDWLVQEIKGPASFKCVNSDDCRFDGMLMDFRPL